MLGVSLVFTMLYEATELSALLSVAVLLPAVSVTPAGAVTVAVFTSGSGKAAYTGKDIKKRNNTKKYKHACMHFCACLQE